MQGVGGWVGGWGRLDDLCEKKEERLVEVLVQPSGALILNPKTDSVARQGPTAAYK